MITNAQSAQRHQLMDSLQKALQLTWSESSSPLSHSLFKSCLFMLSTLDTFFQTFGGFASSKSLKNIESSTAYLAHCLLESNSPTITKKSLLTAASDLREWMVVGFENDARTLRFQILGMVGMSLDLASGVNDLSGDPQETDFDLILSASRSLLSHLESNASLDQEARTFRGVLESFCQTRNLQSLSQSLLSLGQKLKNLSISPQLSAQLHLLFQQLS